MEFDSFVIRCQRYNLEVKEEHENNASEKK